MSINFEELKKAIQRKQEFLKDNPRAQKFQEEIDRELAKGGDSQHNRLAILENLLLEKKKELIRMLDSLSFSTKEFQKSLLNVVDIIRENQEKKDK